MIRAGSSCNQNHASIERNVSGSLARRPVLPFVMLPILLTTPMALTGSTRASMPRMLRRGRARCPPRAPGDHPEVHGHAAIGNVGSTTQGQSGKAFGPIRNVQGRQNEPVPAASRCATGWPDASPPCRSSREFGGQLDRRVAALLHATRRGRIGCDRRAGRCIHPPEDRQRVEQRIESR